MQKCKPRRGSKVIAEVELLVYAKSYLTVTVLRANRGRMEPHVATLALCVGDARAQVNAAAMDARRCSGIAVGRAHKLLDLASSRMRANVISARSKEVGERRLGRHGGQGSAEAIAHRLFLKKHSYDDALAR